MSVTKSTAILWFRRDLRLHDHPALHAAQEIADRVVPLFVFDDALVNGRWPSSNRVAFLLESLHALDEALRARGSALVHRHGRPADALAQIAEETGTSDVFVSRDYGPYARRRDSYVAARLKDAGVRLHARAGTLVQEPEAVRTKDGAPYAVFSPFRRAWEALPRRAILPVPETLASVSDVNAGRLPSLADFALSGSTAPQMLSGGEREARRRLEAWTDSGRALDAYQDHRDRMDLDGTSRLSQDLRWGLLSPLEVLERCAGASSGRQSFVSEICWREFYYHVLYHNPRVIQEPFQRQYSTLDWNDGETLLFAWQEGRTGYPVVDAAMRQLVATGWMHNRARMIVASFLTKDLLIDWRQGERFFMRHLVDGDLASNNGGWQWAASTGTDPQPYFRIFNPVLQGQRFDPSGDFVRRWISALSDVDTKYIHAPWTMPMDVQESSGCVIGRDYPAPIVDHAEARGRALAVYKAARDGSV